MNETPRKIDGERQVLGRGQHDDADEDGDDGGHHDQLDGLQALPAGGGSPRSPFATGDRAAAMPR